MFLRLCKLSFILEMTAMILKSLQKMGVAITTAILYHFHERTLILKQFLKNT